MKWNDKPFSRLHGTANSVFALMQFFPTKPQIPGTDNRAEGHNFSDTTFVEWNCQNLQTYRLFLFELEKEYVLNFRNYFGNIFLFLYEQWRKWCERRPLFLFPFLHIITDVGCSLTTSYNSCPEGKISLVRRIDLSNEMWRNTFMITSQFTHTKKNHYLKTISIITWSNFPLLKNWKG